MNSIIPAPNVDTALIPAVSDFVYEDCENAERLRNEAAVIRHDLIQHNRQKLIIGARLLAVMPLLKD